MMRILSQIIAVSLGCLLLVVCLAVPASALNTMLDYTSFPPIVSEPTKPNVLVMISNDHTGFYPGYNDLYNYDNSIDYWGYFDPLKEYEYNSGVFNPKGSTAADHYISNNSWWSGNFLNWVTMTHADFLRKALTGGQRLNDDTSSTTIIRGNVPNDSHRWKKRYSGADISKLVPSSYANTSNYFSNVYTTMDILNSGGGSLTSNNPLDVVIATCITSMPEENCTPYPAGNMKPEGLLQRYHDKMLFGLMSYSHGRTDRGGILRTPIKDITEEFDQNNGSDLSTSSSMLSYIARYNKKGWDPLAEMFYDGVRYLRGNEAAQQAYCPSGSTDDNFLFYGCTTLTAWVDPVKTWCQKNNIIIINDEYPSRDDDQIPNSSFYSYSDTPAFSGNNSPYNPEVSALTKLIGDYEGVTGNEWSVGEMIGNMNRRCNDLKLITSLAEVRSICPSSTSGRGTFYLGALAYDAFTKDMRPDLDGKQSIRFYGIAFRAAPAGYQVPKPPLNQMWLAGKYGNFDDKNGNNIPDLDVEWMKSAATCNPADPNDYDCLPKGFFYAEGGSAIEDAMVEVFESILRRAASGTSVSVLATSGQGEGNLVQAYYRPAIAEGTRDIKWTGYLQSLWVDKYGYIREDSNHNLKLDEDADSVIKYFLDADGTTRVRRYAVSATNPFPDLANDSFSVVEMGSVAVVWEGGQTLVDTPSSARNITTFIDKDANGVVDVGEIVSLVNANEGEIRPYLALQNDFNNAYLGKTETIRANNLIAFIRGDDPGLDPASFIDPANVAVRDRVLGGKVWKLGDVINSTPVSISAPPDRFDLIYGDKSYYSYYLQYKNRETMVYVGANDGMLHAFTSWQYDQTLQQFIKPSAAGASETVGTEVWSYVPHNLLPHLKWLARPDYTHVHYADLQPRIFDARIFNHDATHPNGWGTVMIVGMNTGGGLIQVTGDFDYDGKSDNYREFKPSFMAFDITNPREPELLWEKTYDGLGFTRTIPTVIRIGKSAADGPGWDNMIYSGDWYLIFGNGPDAGDISGTPNYEGETDSNGLIYIVDLKTGQAFSSTGNDWWAKVPDQRAFFNTPIAYDRFLNYNVDTTYMATAYDNNASGGSAEPHDWKGSVYRILTWDKTTDSYFTNPNRWNLQKLFDSPRPITAPGALSVDHLDNTWAYFGTGRYISKGLNSDEVSTDQEYLIGIKDPIFNKKYQYIPPLYYENITENKNLNANDLLNASPFLILNSGQVLWDNGASYVNPYNDSVDWFFNDLVNHARTKDGWIRALPLGTTAERSLNKPAVVGGLSLYTTFSPKGDVCDYGGSSTLWALYYETGTAFKRAIFRGGFGEETVTISGSAETVVKDSFDRGSGTTSSVGVHLGKQNDRAGADRYRMNADGTFTKDVNGKYIEDPNNPGDFIIGGTDTLSGDIATGFVQQGTGTVIDFEFETALKVRSGLRSWAEQSP